MAKKKTIKKAVKKRSARKTAAKKTSTKSARKPAKKKPAAKTGTTTPIKAILKGEKVCLAGRFSYHPTKGDLQKVIRLLGGTVTETVNDKLTMLLVGDGKKPAKQTKAEKLNSAGTASIQILLSPTELLPDEFEEQLDQYLLDAKSLTSLASLSDCTWLFTHYGMHLSDGDFVGGVVGQKKDTSFQIDLADCDFSRATLQNVYIRPRDGHHGCLFERTRFLNTSLSHLENCQFRQASGTRLGFFALSDSQITKTKLDTLDGYYVTNCDITDSQFGLLSLSGSGGAFRRCKLRKVTVDQFEVDEACDHNEFEDVTINSGKIDEPLVFEKSKFRKVRFRNLKGSTLKFDKCQLDSCSFEGNELGVIDFGTSTVSKCQMKKNQFGVIQATDKQRSQLKGIEREGRVLVGKLSEYPLVKKLGDAIVASDTLEIRFDGDRGADVVSFQIGVSYKRRLAFSAKKDKKHTSEFRFSHYPKPQGDDFARQILWLINAASIDEIRLGSLKTKTSKCSYKSKDLKQLIIGAIYEAMGKTATSDDELKVAAKKSKQKATEIRKEIVAELEQGQAKKVNKRTIQQLQAANPFKKKKMAGVNLSGVKLKELNFGQCDFSNANLSKAQLQESSFLRANFAGCDLSGANLEFANFGNADLTGADLSNAKLRGIKLQGATLKNTNFSKASFDSRSKLYTGLQTDLSGVDLSAAILSGAKLDKSYYDRKTQFPASMKTAALKKLEWADDGVPPHERKQNKKVTGPMDFDQFMERLGEITDLSRLKKSTKMLKAASFQLFCETTDDSVVGVVKSQTDANLVYSCSLNSNGEFCCCTQNLNTCGGLRGSLCKHLLVLVMGLTKDGQLDAKDVDDWVNSSKLKQPELDKDRMSEVLLKYKGAEAGEIDWRPTETVPEDFMAF